MITVCSSRNNDPDRLHVKCGISRPHTDTDESRLRDRVSIKISRLPLVSKSGHVRAGEAAGRDHPRVCRIVMIHMWNRTYTCVLYCIIHIYIYMYIYIYICMYIYIYMYIWCIEFTANANEPVAKPHDPSPTFGDFSCPRTKLVTEGVTEPEELSSVPCLLGGLRARFAVWVSHVFFLVFFGRLVVLGPLVGQKWRKIQDYITKDFVCCKVSNKL